MERLVTWARRLGAIPMAVAAATLFFLMVMTFVDVVLRSAFNAPLGAAPELTKISVAVIVFSALPVLSASNNHISVDLLDPLYHRLGIDRIWRALMAIICGVILFWPAGRVVALAERERGYGDLTEFLSIPVFYVSWFIAILTYAAMVALIVRGLIELFAPRLLEAPK